MIVQICLQKVFALFWVMRMRKGHEVFPQLVDCGLKWMKGPPLGFLTNVHGVGLGQPELHVQRDITRHSQNHSLGQPTPDRSKLKPFMHAIFNEVYCRRYDIYTTKSHRESIILRQSGRTLTGLYPHSLCIHAINNGTWVHRSTIESKNRKQKCLGVKSRQTNNQVRT